jgi:hypothetical protein
MGIVKIFLPLALIIEQFVFVHFVGLQHVGNFHLWRSATPCDLPTFETTIFNIWF